MSEVLRIPIPTEALRIVLGDYLVDEALEHGARSAGSAKLFGDHAIEHERGVAAGFLTVEVTRRLRIADIYSRRLEIAVGLMPRDVRNQYEAALEDGPSNVVSIEAGRGGDAA